MAEKRQSLEDEAFEREVADAPEAPMAAGPRPPAPPPPPAPPQRGLIPDDGGSLGIVGRGLNAGADAVNSYVDHNVKAVKMAQDSKALQFANRWANPLNGPVVATTGKTVGEWTTDAMKDPVAFAREGGKAALEGGTGWGMAKAAADLWNGPPKPEAPGAPAGPGGAPAGPGGDAGPGLPMSANAPPVRNVPAMNMPTVDPKYIGWMQELNKDERDATGRQKDAELELGQAASDQEMSRAAGHQAIADERDAQGQEMQARADARAAQAEQMRARIDATSAEVAARSKENPDQWFQDQGAAKTMGWGVAAFLGGFGKGENEVMKMIKDNVHNNIAAQRQNYEHDRDRVNDMNSLYAQAYHATGDHDAAYDLAAQWQVDAVKEKALAMAASTGSNVEMAKARVLAENLDREKALIGQRGVKQDVAWHKYVPAHQEGGPGAGFVPNQEIQEKLTKAEEAGRIPAVRAAVANARRILQDPNAALSARDRWLVQAALASDDPDKNLQRAMMTMTPERRNAVNAIYQVSVNEAGVDNMRSNPQVVHNFAKNLGTGSVQDMNNGVDITQAVVEGRYRNAQAVAADPREVQYHEFRERTAGIPHDMQKPKPRKPPPDFQADKK